MDKLYRKFLILCFIAIFVCTFILGSHNYDYSDHDSDDVVLSAVSCDLLVNTPTSANDELPEDAVAIDNAEALKIFLLGDKPYGYLTKDILFDWEDVGSTVNFASGRTLDGRGRIITLTDGEATADVGEYEYGAENINYEGIARDCNYSTFINVNEGVIKNIKFSYADDICAVNDGSVAINSVGIVCGENKGLIEKCELNASGKFAYYYIDGEGDNEEEFQTHFGGFAGKNSGRIDKVSVSYEDFYLRIRTTAQSDNLFGDEMSAKTFAGGMVGIISEDGECTNTTISGSNVIFNLTADSLGNGESFIYSGAIAAYSNGKIDNIILDFSPKYDNEDGIFFVSKNAVVHCGSATNVTALNTYDDGYDLRLNNCECSEHIGYCNTIKTDNFTKALVYIDDEGNQVVELTPLLGQIESVSFSKLAVDSEGKITDDSFSYENAPDNFYSQNFASECANGKTFKIQPYQNSGESFWEIKASSWRKAELAFSDKSNYNYTGKDMLRDFIKLTLSDSERYCDFTKMNLENSGKRIYEAKDAGKYSLSIRPIEIDGRKYLYYDEESRVIVIAQDDYVTEVRDYYIAPTLDVIAYASDEEYFSGNVSSTIVSFEATANFGDSNGKIEYRIDGKEWIEYNDIIIISNNAIIEFRATLDTGDEVLLTSEIIVYEVLVLTDIKLVVTADWFEIDSKVYDGTNEVKGIRLNMKSESVIANFAFIQYIEFSAYYSQIDAGDNVEIIIEVWAKDDADIFIDNRTSGAHGIIQRREVILNLDYAEKTYGDSEIEYHYSVINVIDSIDVDFVSNASIYSIPEEEDYRFWLAESKFGNYSIANFEDLNCYDKGGQLTIHKAVISQIANTEHDFAHLDTDSVKDLQVKFRDVIDGELFHILDIFYFSAEENAYMSVDKIDVEGTYNIKLAIPKELQSRYELDESISEMQISVAQSDRKPDDTHGGDNVDDMSEISKDQDNEGIDSDDSKGEDDNFDYHPSDGSSKNRSGVAIAVGVMSSSLVAVGILKRLVSKKRRNKAK